MNSARNLFQRTLARASTALMICSAVTVGAGVAGWIGLPVKSFPAIQVIDEAVLQFLLGLACGFLSRVPQDE